jgi:hypothetical protein
VSRLGLVEAEKRKKLNLLYHVSGEGLRRNALVVLSHGEYIYRGWETQGVAAPRKNPRAAAPGALAPQTTPMGWAKYSRRRWPDTPVTNTNTIL